jgi:hypothetical protein
VGFLHRRGDDGDLDDQQVLGAASDKRAVVTYQDAEAILHECLQMQEHLTAQDGALERMLRRMEQLESRMEKSAG